MKQTNSIEKQLKKIEETQILLAKEVIQLKSLLASDDNRPKQQYLDNFFTEKEARKVISGWYLTQRKAGGPNKYWYAGKKINNKQKWIYLGRSLEGAENKIQKWIETNLEKPSPALTKEKIKKPKKTASKATQPKKPATLTKQKTKKPKEALSKTIEPKKPAKVVSKPKKTKEPKKSPLKATESNKIKKAVSKPKKTQKPKIEQNKALQEKDLFPESFQAQNKEKKKLLETFAIALNQLSQQFQKDGPFTIQLIKNKTKEFIGNTKDEDLVVGLKLQCIIAIGKLQSCFGGHLWDLHYLDPYDVIQEIEKTLKNSIQRTQLVALHELLDIALPSSMAPQSLLNSILRRVSLRANT